MTLKVNYTTPLSFDTKYVLSILDRILVNSWRAETSVSVLKPWISLNKKNKQPSLIQIRQKKFTNQGSIDDYVQKFAESYLYYLSKTAAICKHTHLKLPLSLEENKERVIRLDKAVLSII